MKNINYKTSAIMIFAVLAAIAMSLNNVYLAVEISLVLILAFSPAFLAIARHIKSTSMQGEGGIRNQDHNRFIFSIYFWFLVSILSACLLANIAISSLSDDFPIEKLVDINNLSDAIEFKRRYLKSIKIIADLLISWIMIRLFSGISYDGKIAKGAWGDH